MSLIKEEEEKKENYNYLFQLKAKIREIINKIIYFEQNKKPEELKLLLSINTDKQLNPEKYIFEIIENYYKNNKICLLKKDKNDDCIYLVFTIEDIKEEELKKELELNKKEEIIPNELLFNLLNKNIINLKKELEETKKKYDMQLKDKDNEIKILNKRIKDLEEKKIFQMKNDNIQIKEKDENNIFNEENEEDLLTWKIDPSTITLCISIKKKIDGKNGINDIFETYHLHNDENSFYIASKNITNIIILKIVSLKDFYTIAQLLGHNKNILFIKYFYYEKENKDYLLSSDEENKIIVWIIKDEMNYEKLSILNYGSSLLKNQRINNSLLIFKERKNYILTTSYTNNCSKLFELEDGAFIRDILITNSCKTLYVIKYKHLIIECCNDLIIIYNPFNEEIFDKIKNEHTKGDNRHACISYNRNNTDYLNIINQYGSIIIYDLKKKITSKILKQKGDLYNIIDWNNYLIFSIYDKNYLGIINLENMLIEKSIIIHKNMTCIKNIKLNENKELIIAAGDKNPNIYVLFSSTQKEELLNEINNN